MPESAAEPGTSPGRAPAPGGAPGGGVFAPGGASVGGLQRALAAGTLTSAGITAFYLERIHRLNPALHAVITVSPEAAAEARASDVTARIMFPNGPMVTLITADSVTPVLSAAPGWAYGATALQPRVRPRPPSWTARSSGSANWARS